MSEPVPDPYARLRAATRARIGLGRAGDALPTSALLDFQAAHSAARDAVHGVVDFDALARELAPRASLRLRSQADDCTTYLRRPDLGRRVRPGDRARLETHRGDWDLLIVVADGLSAAGVQTHAVPLIEALTSRLGGLRLAPVVFAEQARVAIGDELGETLGAELVAVLIGERPGLSVADSLGVYLSWRPRIGCPDSLRNCVSNIHGHGLSYAQAADALEWLIHEARRRRLTGVTLKLDRQTERSLENGRREATDPES